MCKKFVVLALLFLVGLSNTSHAVQLFGEFSASNKIHEVRVNFVPSEPLDVTPHPIFGNNIQHIRAAIGAGPDFSGAPYMAMAASLNYVVYPDGSRKWGVSILSTYYDGVNVSTTDTGDTPGSVVPDDSKVEFKFSGLKCAGSSCTPCEDAICPVWEVLIFASPISCTGICAQTVFSRRFNNINNQPMEWIQPVVWGAEASARECARVLASPLTFDYTIIQRNPGAPPQNYLSYLGLPKMTTLYTRGLSYSDEFDPPCDNGFVSLPIGNNRNRIIISFDQ